MIFKKFSRFSLGISAPRVTHETMDPDGGMIKARSYDSLDKLTGCFANMHKEVDDLLVTCERDIREAPQLMRLVSDFFNINDNLSSLCESLKQSLKLARLGESIIAEALHDFEDEKRVSGDDGSFRKTLQDLKIFSEYSEYEDPFLVDFAEKFRNCEGGLINSINELNATLKELKRTCRQMRIATTLLTVVAAPVLAFVAVAGVMVPPPAGKLIGEAVTAAPAGLGVSSWWRKTREMVKRQKNATSSMERGTCVALNEVKKIKKLVDQLKKVLKSMGQTAEFAAKKRSPVHLAIREIEMELETFKATVGDLGEEAERCGENIAKSRTVVRTVVTGFLTP